MRSRSHESVVPSSVDVKTWRASLPSVEAVRPGQCPSCGAAGRPLGEAIGLVGHGVRSRQIRGPTEPGGPPELVVISVRRYRCRRCGRTVTVVPRGVVGRRHYSRWAIALACWAVGCAGWTLSRTRQRVAPGRTDEPGWVAVSRWLRAIAAGRLLRCVRPWPKDFALRQRAERVATTVMAMAAGRYDEAEAHLFAGAALAF